MLQNVYIIVKSNCVDNVSGSYFVGYIIQLQCCSKGLYLLDPRDLMINNITYKEAREVKYT